jgi:hypothetical protein
MPEHKHSCKWCGGVRGGLYADQRLLLNLERKAERKAGTAVETRARADMVVLRERINKTKRILQEHEDAITYGQEN